VPEGTDDPRLSAEGELALARMALADGDLSHAASHIAGALAHAPTMPEVHEALAQLAARSPGAGVDLYPLDGPVYVGTVVARAHLLASAGAYGEALELLAAATAHKPQGDWAGVPWVLDPQLPGRLTPDSLARVFATVCAQLADPVPEQERGPLRAYLTLARHAVRAHPDDPALLGTASALARRLGEHALAIEWARHGTEVQPGKLTEVWLGYAYRSAGRVGDAVAAWQRALAYDPGDLAVHADIASTLADAGRLDEAIGWAERALAIDPTNDCAVHTAYRLRFRRDENVAHLVGLVDYTRAHPVGSHEHSDLADSCQGRPWLGHVPPASEAVINILRQVLEKGDVGANGQLTVSSLEPPSAMAVLLHTLPGLDVRIQQILPPDIRTPRRAVGLRLWRYEGTRAVPAVPPPAPASQAALVEVAYPAWPHPPAAYDRAVRLAAVPPADLLAALVHPPAPPDNELGQTLARHDPSLWVRTVQTWACLGLLHHGTDEPWGPSTRRRTLVDLVFGDEDWIAEAAMFSMITAAWLDPTARSDVAALVRERLADVAQVAAHRPVTIAWSMARLALMTPDLAPDATRLAREIVAVEEEPGEEAEEEEQRPSPLDRLRRLLPRRSRTYVQ